MSRAYPFTTRQRIIEAVKHGAPLDPKRWQELVEWVRAYYGQDVNSETIRRTACKLREQQRINA